LTRSDEAVVIARNLCKTINGREIVKDVSFEVFPGEIFGFLGPNGAGKTTTIRMVTGLIKPTSGTVHIMGHSVQSAFRQAMLYLGGIVENPSFYKYMTGWQNLLQLSRVSGIHVTREHLEWCVETVELTDRIHDKVGTYSLGMKQRLGIAQALLASPKLLILDEPTNGMDPSGIKDMRTLIRRLADEHGLSVFISSHLLSEVELLCDRVVIINDGKSIVSGNITDLTARSEESKFLLTIDALLLEKAFSVLSQQYDPVQVDSNNLCVRCPQEEIPQLVNQLFTNGVGVYLIAKAESNTLESYFLEVTKGEQA
jgi:ABC-2 type transport system ATP-binding protein